MSKNPCPRHHGIRPKFEFSLGKWNKLWTFLHNSNIFRQFSPQKNESRLGKVVHRDSRYFLDDLMNFSEILYGFWPNILPKTYRAWSQNDPHDLGDFSAPYSNSISQDKSSKTLFIPFPTSFYMKMAFLIRGSPSSFLIGQFPLPLSSVEIFELNDWSVFSARGVVSNKYEDWFSSNPAFALRPKSKQPKLFSRYQTYYTHKKLHHTTNRLVDLSDWRNRLEEKKSKWWEK